MTVTAIPRRDRRRSAGMVVNAPELAHKKCTAVRRRQGTAHYHWINELEQRIADAIDSYQPDWPVHFTSRRGAISAGAPAVVGSRYDLRRHHRMFQSFAIADDSDVFCFDIEAFKFVALICCGLCVCLSRCSPMLERHPGVAKA